MKSLTSNTDNSTIINPNGGNIAESTLVYNDGLSGLKPSGFYFWSNDKWNCINCKEYGNLKHSFKASDHNGWYLLDGRSTSSLSTNAQAIATALGLGANLFTGFDYYIMPKIYLGAEVSYGLAVTNTKPDGGDGVTKIQLAPSITPSFRIGWQF